MKIFFSYPHDSSPPLVQRLKHDLEARGHEVWIDTSEIKAGHDWRERITRGILDSQRVVAFLSAHAVRVPGVCLNEIAIALAADKGDALVTVLVEPEEKVQAPLSITHIQFVRMEDWADRQANTSPEEWEGWYRTKLDELVQALEDPQHASRDEELATLRQHLRPQRFVADMARHVATFTGRRWLIDAFDDWLVNQPQSRVLRFEGGPGLGKTALACYLAHVTGGSVVALHLCKYQDPASRDPVAFVKTLAYQLATRLPDYRARLLQEPLLTAPPPAQGGTPAQYAQTLFTGLISNLLVHQMDRQSLAVVVDGLDEATEPGADRNPIARLLAAEIQNLPPWLGVVMTGRPDPELAADLARYRPLTLDGQDPRNLADLQTYVDDWLATSPAAAELQPDQRGAAAKGLLEASDGSFLYVTQAREAVEGGLLDLCDPQGFPQGLAGLYRNFFERRFADAQAPQGLYKARARPLLELLLASPTALPVSLARELLNWDDYTEPEVLSSLGSLLTRVPGPAAEAGQTEPWLALFHHSVHEWLADAEQAGPWYVSSARTLPTQAAATLRRYLAQPPHEAYAWGALPKLLGRLVPAAQNQALGELGRDDLIRLTELAEALQTAYRLSEARLMMRVLLTQFEALLARAPESGEAQRDVSVGLDRVGDTMRQLGEPHEALPLYRRSLVLSEALLARAPDSGEAQRDVSVSLDNVGDTLRQLGEPHEALPLYRRSLALREALLARAPDSGEAQRDVSVSLDKVGDTLSQLGEPHEALPLYRRSLALREALLARAPDSGQAQRDVSVSLDKVGDTLRQLGEPHEALPLYRRSLVLSEALLARAPDSGEAQRDVLVALYNVGSLSSGTEQEAALQRLFGLMNEWDTNGRLTDPFFIDLLRRWRDQLGGDEGLEPA